MAKQLKFNNNKTNDVRDSIKSGVAKLADAVKVTLGPTGRVVMFEREFGDPVITKDGVTVAGEVELQDPFENMGVRMVRQATSKTAKLAGDGTTTATIYTQAIFEAGLKHVNSGANPQSVKRGIDKSITRLVDMLSDTSRPVKGVEEIKQIAVCSANQDKIIGQVVANAIEEVGRSGVVTIEEGTTLDTRVQLVDGMQFNQGLVSHYLANNESTMNCEFENPLIVIIDEKLVNVATFVKVLEKIYKDANGRPVVLIADEFSDEIISLLVVNKMRSGLKIAAVKAPGFGDRKRDTIQDIAVVTGATVLSSTTGISIFDTRNYAGSCCKIEISQDATTIIEGSGSQDKINERIDLIQRQMDVVAGDFDREKLQERLARLTGGVAQIIVGGATEAEVREKKDRIDDALHACKAAIDEGILPGGGVAVLHCKDQLTIDYDDEDELIGLNIVKRALEAPLRQLAINTGVDDGVVVDRVSSNDDFNFGYNAVTREYGDMIEFGIVVPTKVERIALQNAGSIAGLLLTTDCMIASIPENSVEDDAQSPLLG